MKPLNFLLAVFVVLISSSIIPAVAAPGTDRSQIQAALDLMNKGLLDRNVNEIVSSYTPDCIGKDMDGDVITHKQLLDALPQIFTSVKFISAKTTILTFPLKAEKPM